MKKMLSLVVAALSLYGNSSFATIIWDYSPETTNGSYVGTYSNYNAGQNFAERINFSKDVHVTGMDIYSMMNFTDGVIIRIWSENNNLPNSLLYAFNSSISEIDKIGSKYSYLNRLHTNFSVDLSANVNYWIGFSGINYDIGQTVLSGVNDGVLAWFNGTTYQEISSIGDMAFRLEGSVNNGNPVPEPETMLLVGIGLAGLAAVGRRRKRN